MEDGFIINDDDNQANSETRIRPSRFSAASLNASALVLAVIFLLSLAEIVLRYFFHSPIVWVFDINSYLLCATIFLALPYVVDSGGSITISLLTDLLRGRVADRTHAVLEFIAAVTCLVIAAFFFDNATIQFEGSVMTIATLTIPQWVLSAAAVYGFMTAAFFHFRRAVILLRLPQA